MTERAGAADEALEALRSADVPVRLDAARALSHHARPQHLTSIRAALRIESDELVTRVLERTVASLERAVDEDPELPDVVHQDALERERAKTLREATGMFLHEITPLIGQFEIVASQETVGYEGGPLFDEIERIRETLGAFEDLRSAAESGEAKEFNMTDLVTSLVRREVEVFGPRAFIPQDLTTTDDEDGDEIDIEHKIRVTLANSDPVISVGSPRLVKLAYSNAIRNALEAVAECLKDRDGSLVASWGTTNVDSWIAVVDNGPGLDPALGSPWAVGRTTKASQGHSGLGLVIVEQAVRSMGGKVDLSQSELGGCRFEIRWRVDGSRT